MDIFEDHPADGHDEALRRAELDRLRVVTQADLQRLWELLMQPLGFRSTSLWVTFIGPDRRPTRFLLEVAEADDVPGPEEVANLYAVLDQVLHEEGAGTTAGPADHQARSRRPDLLDRRWGQRLLEGARTSGVPVEPLHVATDLAVLALTPDDLAA